MKHLVSCEQPLVDVFMDAIEVLDIKILCGYRNQAAQNEAFSSGHSSKQWPDSRHNVVGLGKSSAIDAAPYPIDWRDQRRFDHFAGFIRGIAWKRGVELLWGGDWNRDYKFLSDQKFNDLVHFELVERK